MPDGIEAKPYQSIIGRLASLQNAPEFRPHLAIGSVRSPIDLDAFAQGNSSISLNAVKIEAEPVFTRSLVISFDKTDALMNLRSQIESLPDFTSNRPFNPHISLCYGEPPRGASEFPDVHQLLGKSVTFTRLAQMEIKLPVNCYDAVSAWRERSSVSLL